MPPLPQQNTARVWIQYNDGYNDHEMMIRHIAGMTASEALAYGVNFFEALSPILNTITILGARAAAVNSVFSVPVAWPGAATYGTGIMQAFLAPRQLCFLGRTSGGRRARWFVFGYNGATPPDYRLTQAEEPEIGDTLQAMITAQLDGAFIAIDGLDPQMSAYADVNFNSYYEQKARG